MSNEINSGGIIDEAGGDPVDVELDLELEEFGGEEVLGRGIRKEKRGRRLEQVDGGDDPADKPNQSLTKEEKRRAEETGIDPRGGPQTAEEKRLQELKDKAGYGGYETLEEKRLADLKEKEKAEEEAKGKTNMKEFMCSMCESNVVAEEGDECDDCKASQE
jgi:hypothetical protein